MSDNCTLFIYFLDLPFFFTFCSGQKGVITDAIAAKVAQIFPNLYPEESDEPVSSSNKKVKGKTDEGITSLTFSLDDISLKEDVETP